jgi:cytochrome P450
MLENIFQDGHERFEARMKRDTVEHSDLLGHISDYNAKSAPSDQLSTTEIEQNVLAIIVGGSETLTTTFSGAFHYLLADQTKLDRLSTEIRSSFTSAVETTSNAVARISYLNAVIDETLRMCPPIQDMLRRQVPKHERAEIAGRVVPTDTTVSLSCYAIFKSEEYFSAPETFKPLRFINKTPRQSC